MSSHDERFDQIDQKTSSMAHKLQSVDQRLDGHDSKLDHIFNCIKDIDKRLKETNKRIDNLVDVVAGHTDILKSIDLRTNTIERHMESNLKYVQNLDSDIGILYQRVSLLENPKKKLSMLRDAEDYRYKYDKPKSLSNAMLLPYFIIQMHYLYTGCLSPSVGTALSSDLITFDFSDITTISPGQAQ